MKVWRWPALVLGALISLIGVVLAAGGAWLLVLGGSPYYVLTGIAMIASGVLLGRGRMLGGWLYLAIVALTIGWAFWETGGLAWALVPRVVAPLVLLLLLIPVVAALSLRTDRWRLAGGSAVALLAVSIAGGLLLTHDYDTPPSAALPPASSQAMNDPAGQATGAEWPAYGGTQAARRFSPLTQISPANVDNLERVWLTHTGDLPSSEAKGTYGAENTPLKIGDTLYLCTPKNIMIALNAATGEERWRYDPQVPDRAIPYTAACRGVVYHETEGAAPDQPCAARVIEGTLDARLVAVDARTGRPCPDFGGDGDVSILPGMGEVP